jgi:hypothetical protein
MKRGAFLVLLLLVVACSKKPVPTPPAEASAPAASKVVEPAVRDAGPPPNPPDRSAARADREKAVLAFIHSGRAADLPEQALEGRRPWDSDLVYDLAPAGPSYSKIEEASLSVEGGGFEDGTVRRVLVNWNHRFEHCYEIERELRPDLTGVVTLHLELESRGNVKNVTGETTMNEAAALLKCCINEVKPLSFGQPIGGALVKINYGIKFTPPAPPPK